MSDLDQQIFELWCELHPTTAYNAGIEKFVSKVFMPTDEAIEKAQSDIDVLLSSGPDDSQTATLTWLRRELLFEEPYMFPDSILWVLYGYMVREGVVVEHLSDLMDQQREALVHVKKRMIAKDWPVEVKVLINNNTKGAIGIIQAMIEDEPGLRPSGEKLVEDLKEYLSHFKHPGVDKGHFDEVFSILENDGGDIGRSEIYPLICKEMYGYTETVDEIEAKGQEWLAQDLPKYQAVVKKLAGAYGCDETVEAVTASMNERRSVPVAEAVGFVQSFRSVFEKVVVKHLCGITPNYDTRVVETPDYLVNLIPTAAMSSFDYFSDKPFNVFFLTTSDKVSPAVSIPSLLQTLIHEEYGHCVNFSNSSTRYAADPSVPELIHSQLAMIITDGISFNREQEAQGLLRKLGSTPKDELEAKEKALIEMLEGLGDLELLMDEMEFIVLQWRVVRFLRAIGDSRINSGKQSIAEFANWGAERTGLSNKLVFNQIFIFQGMVGYAPCYSLGGQRIKARQEGMSPEEMLKFNTYISSMGFPTWRIFESRWDGFKDQE